MPIYEYRCGNCQRRVSIFVKGLNYTQSLECPKCGGLDLSRLFSKFSIGKGEWYQRNGIYEDILSDHQLVRGLESNHPRALAEWNRRMSRGADEEIIPEYEEMTEKLEAGEPLENVMGEAEAAMDSVGG